ncbi:MAG: response regulator [bacterium]|nr:response regulator [bacterium]
MMGNRHSLARSLIVAITCGLAALPAAGSRPEKNLRFQRISLGDGLSQAAVDTIIQDRRGFMWFGTKEGLNRFDGTNFIAFQHDPADPASLSHDSVRAIVEDQHGALWIGSDNGGLDRFDESTQTFTHFRHDPENPNSLGSDRVRTIHLDIDGALWIGTDGGGLSRFEPKTGSFTRYASDPDDPFSLSHQHVRDVLRDSAGRLWVGTEGGGLNLLDVESGRFRRFRHDPADNRTISGDHIYSVYESGAGGLWIGTRANGLNRLDPGTSRFHRYEHDPSDPTSLSAGVVRCIFQDRNGVLLVGTDEGLSEWNPATDSFKVYRHNPADPFSLSDSRVDAIYQDRGGVIWLGTKIGINKWNPATGSFPHYKARKDDPSELSHDYVTSFAETADGAVWIGTVQGLNRLDRDRQSFKRFLHDPENPGSLASSRVGSLMADRKGGLWVGTVRNGVDYMAPSSTTFIHFRHSPDDPGSLSFNSVIALYEDSLGTVWVGTYRGGLNRFDPERGGFIRYRHDPDDPTSLSSDRVVAIFEDSRGNFWVGTDGGGINRMDRNRGTFVSYENDPRDPTSLSSSHSWTISESADGDLYIGTQGGGLNRWKAADRDAGRAAFKRYFKRDGLLSAVLYGMLWDDNGQLWVSSNRGLAVFDPAAEIFRNYNTSHGLQSEEFNIGAALRAHDGQMFFGGINGFNAFYPENIRTNDHIPPVVLTGVLKLNEAATFDKPLPELDEIELGYKDTMVTLDFAALDFTAPEKNRYRYILEGFDRDWVDLGTRNRATYTNLDAGEYVFNVQGANNDGVWNEEGFSLKIRALPAPWATWWAYGSYASIAALIALYYLRAQLRERTRAKQLAKANLSLEEEIGRRLAKEQALFREKAKAQEYFQVAEVIMLVLDSDGNIVLVNSKGCEVLGYDEAELIGRNWFDTVVAEPAPIRDRFANNQAQVCTEYSVITKTGSERIVAWQTTYLSDEQGQPAGTLSSGSDITRIKRLQEEKESAETASRAKSQFLANVGHEMRTPMNGVLGMLELLMNSNLDSQQTNCAEKARRSAVNLLGILNEILDFSKIEAGKVELEYVDFDLREITNEVVQLFTEPARQKGLQLRTTLPRTLPTALCADPTRLRQVLINLVGNAVKFTDSGYVELEVSALETADEEIRLRFCVQDTGIGIEPEHRATIFESFQQADGSTTRNYGGTGLGLAISKAFVEIMGGEIGVDSTLGEGSTFWFQVRLARQAAEKAAKSDGLRPFASSELELSGRRILLVEDNPVNQEVAIGMLEGLGGVVDAASNGLEALEALQKNLYELVFMDCQMPKMDGYTATREIRRLEGSAPEKEHRHVQIVAMTAHAMAGERDKCLAAGMDDYLSKPFSQDQLRLLIAKWLPTDTTATKPSAARGEKPALAKLLPLPAAGSLPNPDSRDAAARQHSHGPPINQVLQQKYLWGPLTREGAQRVIRVYLDTSPMLLENMREAVASGNLAELAEMSHKLRSSSGMLGASQLSELCGRTEDQARGGSTEAFELLSLLEREFKRVAAALVEQVTQSAVS